jgi:hypothetical protein
MRFVIILLLSLCHLVVKAHDHTCKAENSRPVSHAQVNGENNGDTYISTGTLNANDEYVVVIDDDDNDNVSARRYTLLVKAPIVQFYLQLFSDFYQSTYKNQFSCSQSLIIPTDRYITQRVLRI